MKGLKVSLVFGLIAAAISCGGAGTTNTQNTAASNTTKPANSSTPVATPADTLAMGRDLFKQNCAICHKEDGTGGKVTIEGKSLDAEDLTDNEFRKATDEKLIGYITNGVKDEGMPAFKDKLTEAQIREVVSYIRGGIQKEAAEPAKPAS